MVSIQKMSGVALMVVAAMAQAQTPYELNGLHTELVFTEAIAQAEKLGGTCQITTSAAQGGGTSAQCEYSPCTTRDQTGACEQQDAQAPGLTIAAQPILQIILEAPGDSARLTRIGFVYDGNRDAVAERLSQMFGPPSSEIHSNKKSWSHSQRLSWKQGIYHVGLLDSPKLIVLGADRSQE